MITSTHSHPRALTGRAMIVTGAARERGAAVWLADVNAVNADVLDQTVDQFAVPSWHSESERDRPAAHASFGKVDALVTDVIATNEPKSLAGITAEDGDLVSDVAAHGGPFVGWGVPTRTGVFR